MPEQQTKQLALKPTEFAPLPETGPLVPPWSPDQHTAIGFKHYLRVLRVAVSMAAFAARVLFNNRPWLRSKKAPSRLQHREGAVLREKLIRLGQTFIKIGRCTAL